MNIYKSCGFSIKFTAFILQSATSIADYIKNNQKIG